jgi:hypothetical protein
VAFDPNNTHPPLPDVDDPELKLSKPLVPVTPELLLHTIILPLLAAELVEDIKYTPPPD